MKKIIKTLILTVTLFAAAAASACSFGPDADIMKSAEENLNNKDVAVLLKIESINDNADTRFSVSKYYKGSGPTETFTLVNPGHSCALTFSRDYVGDYFIMFLNNASELDELGQWTPYKRFETEAEANTFVLKSTIKISDPVKPENPVACTMQYDPVCAQQSIQCIKAPCPQPEPKTYGNSCMAGAENAKILYKGECEITDGPTTPTEEEVFCTEDAMQCPDGSWVGRSGPNCQFVCSTDYNEPTTRPEDGFVEPTSPPPSEQKPNILKRIINWFKGLFS